MSQVQKETWDTWVAGQCPLLHYIFSARSGKWSMGKLMSFCKQHNIPFHKRSLSQTCAELWKWLVQHNNESTSTADKDDSIPILKNWMSHISKASTKELQLLFELKQTQPALVEIRRKKPVAELTVCSDRNMQEQQSWCLMNFLQAENWKRHQLDICLYFSRIHQIHRDVQKHRMYILQESFDLNLSEYMKLNGTNGLSEHKESSAIWQRVRAMLQHLMSGLYLLMQMGYQLGRKAITLESVGLNWQNNKEAWSVKWKAIQFIEPLSLHPYEDAHAFGSMVMSLGGHINETNRFQWLSPLHPLYPMSKVAFHLSDRARPWGWQDVFSFLQQHTFLPS